MNRTSDLSKINFELSKQTLTLNFEMEPGESVPLFCFLPGYVEVKRGAVDIAHKRQNFMVGSFYMNRLAWFQKPFLRLKAITRSLITVNFKVNRSANPIDVHNTYILEEVMDDKTSSKKIDQAYDMIVANHSQHQSLSEISEAAELNRFDFIRKFKKIHGVTPKKFDQLVRVYDSMDGLFFKNQRCIDVALDHDFSDQSHFIKAFKKTFGKTPKSAHTQAFKSVGTGDAARAALRIV